MFEVGQEVWDTAFGEGEVVDYDEEDYSEHPVKVRFKNGCIETYTKEGTIFKDCKRSLFFSEPVVTAELFPPKKPSKSVLKAGDLIAIKDEHCSGVVIVSFLKEDDLEVTTESGSKYVLHKGTIGVTMLTQSLISGAGLTVVSKWEDVCKLVKGVGNV